MTDQKYDVVASDGRLLNERPLSYRDALLFSLDADIDSEDTSIVVPSTRTVKVRRKHADNLLVVIAVALFAALAWRLL